MTLQQYYNRFNASQGYDELLFRAAKGLQSAELNEIQSIQADRLKRIADVLFKDGSVISDAQAVVNAETGATQMGAGTVYVLGAVRPVAAATFTIPTTGTVQIGVRVVTTSVTELEDAQLRDPAVGTRNYQEPGAGRTRRQLAWGYTGDGGAGDFYPVYTVVNGVLLDQAEPPNLDPVVQLIARYDRESNGSYVVRGLNVQALGLSGAKQFYSVGDGVANVEGFKIDKQAAQRLGYTEDPDLQQIANEPKTSASSGSQTITLNYKPLESILDVVVTKEKTVTVTHGAFSGSIDPLPDTSVLSIQSVTQGGTTYTAGTDYVLSGDSVSWAPAGAEPAPGSTYSVTYRYLTSVTPSNVNLAAGTFDITGAVSGTLVLIDYRWKLPRIDVLAMNQVGELLRVKGVSHPYAAARPLVPSNLLALATIDNAWGGTPSVVNDATRVTDMGDISRMKGAIGELYGLIAAERLKTDISSKEPTSKSGVFVDPFLDDDLRDAGITQTAVVLDGELQLPMTASVLPATANNTTTLLLPFTHQVLVEQPLRTGSMKINPYQAFTPIPARVSLNPAVDQWTITQTQTTEITRSLTSTTQSGSSVSLSLLSETRTAVEFLRQQTVTFTVEGFDPNEDLLFLLFDNLDITPWI